MTRSAADCFAPDADMLRADQAVARLLAAVECGLGTETVPLAAAQGRVLAETLVSERTVPPHDNAAVDGYAVRNADLSAGAETELPVAARIAAGHPRADPVPPGSAVRIFTGAAVPTGLDTVIPQEACRVLGDRVALPGGVRKGANLRRAGEDIRAGDAILRAGSRLRPQELGLAASVGRTGLVVFRPLRVAVFSTGDEVREPGAPIPEGCIYDSNRYTISALLTALGVEVTDLGILPDRLDAVRDGLERAARDHDMLVTSGGVSTGEEDHVKAAVTGAGGLHFWRIAVRPGRPLAMGFVQDAPFVGLPGNPVAAMITFLMVVRPMVLKLMGREASPLIFQRVRAGFSFRKREGRREWLRVRLHPGEDGIPVAERFPAEGSGILTSMTWASGLIDLPEELPEVREGDAVNYISFADLLA